MWSKKKIRPLKKRQACQHKNKSPQAHENIYVTSIQIQQNLMNFKPEYLCGQGRKRPFLVENTSLQAMQFRHTSYLQETTKHENLRKVDLKGPASISAEG